MKTPKEQAKTILEALKRIDDKALKKELVLLFLAPYTLYTKKKVSDLQETELIKEIVKFLQDVAEGRIVIGEEAELVPNIPDIKSLVDELERAQRKGLFEEAQVRKALIRAFLAQKRKEQAEGTYPPPFALPELPISKPLRMVVPRPPKKPEAEKEEKVKKEKIIDQLLIRISYKRPSILNLVAQELSKIPAELPGAVFETQEEIIPVLINHGVGPEKLRLALENFRLQNPGFTENHPIVWSLRETLETLTDYSGQHPWVDGLIKTYQNEINVDLSLISGSEKEIPNTNSLVFLKAVIGSGKEDVPRLFIVPPAKKEGDARVVSVSDITKQALVPKNIISRFLVSFKKLLTLPASLLAGLRGYLGGVFIASALFLPLPLPLRIVLAGGGFWLGWKQIKSFFGDFVPQILSGVKRVELFKLFSKTVGDILYTIFTKPALGWLRNALAVGFGAGGLLLPVSIPLKILFLGIGGMFGTVQIGAGGSSFLLRGMGVAGRVGVRLSYALAALPGIPVALILGAILVAVLVPGFLAYQSAQSQALFLPQGGFADRQSRYIGVSKTTPQTDFENTNIPDVIPFKITIIATQDKLTNVSINDQTTASGKDISETIGTQNWKIAQITDSWTTDYSLNISPELKNKIKDSILINIVTVTADVEGVSGTQTSSFSMAIQVGTPPDECPSGWPIANGWVNQGPDGPVTHQGDEAIDIHGDVGTPVIATFRGTAYAFTDQYGGKDVEVFGTCNGVTIRVLFVHLNTQSVPAEGKAIRPGDQLGTRGKTGFASSPHLHYQFKNGLRMAPPFIPVAVPRGCVGDSEFNKTGNPCNVRIK